MKYCLNRPVTQNKSRIWFCDLVHRKFAFYRTDFSRDTFCVNPAQFIQQNKQKYLYRLANRFRSVTVGMLVAAVANPSDYALGGLFRTFLVLLGSGLELLGLATRVDRRCPAVS
jgi:hypothetical protein